ncbi:MAG: hypothetical protein CMO80_09175 [Verrucomicrobiales bacterium]|nr:hypothetical protein [Verrucomicrobiales bacterium]|tara:strand:+ start:425 stop:736 length:312 start_codon:yes stop_codon:yes gene_type:complete
MISHPIGLVRLVGILEGISFLLLFFVAMPLKYMADQPLAVRIVGMAHGVLFIAYAIVVLRAKFSVGWKWKRAAGLMFAALFPFGPFIVDGGLKKEQLESESAN